MFCLLLLALSAAAGSWQKDAEAAARQQAAGSSEQASGQQAGDTFPAGRQQWASPPRLPLQRTIPSFSAMVFSCPAGDFFEAVLRQQPQATEAVEKCCFSKISEVTLTFLAWFWDLLVLQRYGVFPPAGDFFEAVLRQQPQATEAVEKGCFSRISEVTLGTFLAWFWDLLVLQRHGVFRPAGDFFEAVLRQQPQATEAVEKGCFSRISEVTLGTFLAWFWNLLVLQRHGVFPPAGDFFEAVLRQQPQATEAVEKGCFSRISEVTLGTFLAWFWNLLVLQRHGVFPPAGDFFEAVLRQQPQATEAVEKGWFSRISEVTLGTFLAWFWNLFVLQRHGVVPPAGDFFEAVFLQQPQATEAVEKGCFSTISEVTLGSFLAWFRSLLVLQRHGAGNRSCRKRLFFEDFRSDVRQFFGVVLELARPSDARCFPSGGWFFRSCFTAAAAGNRSCRKR